MKSAIVTGANGFLGTALVRELAEQDVQVLALDLAFPEDKFSGLTQVRTLVYSLHDIRNLPLLLPQQYEVFYHFAWEGSAGPKRVDTSVQLKNAADTVECVRVAKEMGCIRFVGAGSIMEREVLSITKKADVSPEAGHIYSCGKLVAHTMAECVANALGIEFIWGIITNAFGIGETSPRLINSVLRSILEEQPIPCTQGYQNYDFLYITDIATAFYLLGELGHSSCEYILGSGHPRPLREFLCEIQAEYDAARLFKFGAIPFTGVSLPLSDYNTDLLQDHTGFSPKLSFIEGVRKTVAWQKELMR